MNFNSYIVSETKTAFSIPLTKNLVTKKTFKQKAFTLAETLITLSIIGVVAAVTVPTLMSNVNKQIYVTGLKKAYNELQNAVRMMPITAGCSADDFHCLDLRTDILAEQLKLAKAPYACRGFDQNNTCLQTPDGMLIYAADNNNINSTIGVDINGAKGPNVVGRDRFFFESFFNSYEAPECIGFLPVGSKLYANCQIKVNYYNAGATRYWNYNPQNPLCTTSQVSHQKGWFGDSKYCTGRVLEENAMNY